jgi:hypothetical protein
MAVGKTNVQNGVCELNAAFLPHLCIWLFCGLRSRLFFSNNAPYKILIALDYLNFAVCLLLFANHLNSAQT